MILFNWHETCIYLKQQETHILHNFDSDLYDCLLKVCICGFIRPEKNFDSLSDLIAGINEDIECARNALSASEFTPLRDSDFFSKPHQDADEKNAAGLDENIK